MGAIWSVERAPQLSGWHLEPIRLGKNHSRRVNETRGCREVELLLCHRLVVELGFNRSPLLIVTIRQAALVVTGSDFGLVARVPSEYREMGENNERREYREKGSRRSSEWPRKENSVAFAVTAVVDHSSATFRSCDWDWNLSKCLRAALHEASSLR